MSGDNPAPVELLAIHIHAGPAHAGPLHPKLRDLLACWQQACNGRAMPARADLPVRLLKPWLGHLALLEPEPHDFRIRLGGTELIARFGMETTGLTLSDLPPDIRKSLRAAIDLVFARRAPVATALNIRFEGRRLLYSELLLPLSAGAGVTMLLFASYPVSARDSLA